MLFRSDLDKIETGSGKMAAVGGALMLVAGGMLIMSLAAAKLAEVDPIGLIQATIAMTVLMETLQDILKTMDDLDMNAVKTPDDGIYEIDCLTGAFIFMRFGDLGKTAFLDENFFMYGEDIDLCYRIKQDEWKIIYYGKSCITHLKGASSKKQKSKLIYEFYRAMYIYYKKHHANETFFLVNIFVYLGIIILCILKLLTNLFKKKN